MLRNYLILAWRNIQRNKVNSFINIAGLAIALASVILIGLYIRDELKYDRFFTGVQRIFQVNMLGTDNGVQATTGNTAPAVGPTMASSFPEIASYVRIYRPGDIMVRYEEIERPPAYFTEKQIMAVDSNFLQVFNYPLLEGDVMRCLTTPNSLVITAATANKYFGNTHVVGKQLLFGLEKKPYIISAVLHDIPPQSSFQFDILAPISAFEVVKKRSWNWFWLQVNTYVQLKQNIPVDPAGIRKLEAKFPPMVAQHAFQRQGTTYEEFTKKGNRLDYELMSFADVHLYAGGRNVNARLTTLGNIRYIYIFALIAVFIIVLACVNFMNLSTAQSAKRAKEVGIRKVLGSLRTALVKQFLSEALLYSVIATLLALVLVLVLIKPFNDITGKSLAFGTIFTGYIWIFILLLCLLTGLLAGIYPAFYLTSFNPVQVLKGMKTTVGNLGNLVIRNGMVVFQFSISIALIICTLVVFRQLSFIRNKDLGFDKEHVVIISNTDRLKGEEEDFRKALTTKKDVISASISSSIPTRVNFGDGYEPEASETDKPLLKEIGLSSFMVDNDFIPTYQMQILKGRNFAQGYPDSASVILNETAAKMIGWKDPTGKYLNYPGNSQRFKVIGVVKDFNIASLHEVVEPFALFHESSQTYNLGHSFISVRLRAGNTANQINELEKNWKGFVAATPFDYSFLDETVSALYRSEQQMGTVFGIFTFLSVFIACLGLFGLSVYTVERRTKEIGVRKILGASVRAMVTLLSWDFLKLVILSGLIAFPVSWFAMHAWLQDFAFRITIGWSVFVIAAVGALLIAFLTISFQTFRAAMNNPVKSIRTE